MLAVFGDVRTFDAVHHHALAGAEVAHDLVAGNRIAAAREAEHAALGAGDQDLFAAVDARGGRRQLRARPASAPAPPAPACDCPARCRPATPRGGGSGVRRGTARSCPAANAIERTLARLQRAVEHAVAEVDRILVLEPLEEMPDRRARLAGDHELQPLRPRRCRWRGDDLHGLAADQLACAAAPASCPRARPRRGCRRRCARRRRSRARWRCAAATGCRPWA